MLPGAADFKAKTLWAVQRVFALPILVEMLAVAMLSNLLV